MHLKWLQVQNKKDLLNIADFIFFYFFNCQVESYVAHIRTLLEERECLTAEYERDNEELRLELHQIKHQLGEDSKLLIVIAFLCLSYF